MKLISQTRDSITVELTPLQLEVLRQGLSKELTYRRKVWKGVAPRFPEELLYHAAMADTAEQLLYHVNKGIKIYREWDIIK